MNNLGPQFNNFENLNKMEKEKFRLEIAKYHELEKGINSVDGLNIENDNQKMSLAFFVEEMKKINPDSWEEDIDNFKLELKKVSEEGGDIKASWLLTDKIGEVYFKFLDNRIDNLEDEETKKKVKIIKEMAQQIIVLNDRMKAENKKTAFGGVSSDYAPKWRQYI